jgi:outer membrane immunogenic protein
MKKLLLATVAGMALVAAGSANAADLGPAYKAPPPVLAPVPWSWTGFYIGAHIGGGWGTKETFDSGFEDPIFAGKAVGTSSVTGFLGGFQAGYNYQISWIVVGIDGDFSFSDVKGTRIENDAFAFGGVSVKSDWFATLTGRIGGAVDHALLYVKGGVAWTQDKFGIDCGGTCTAISVPDQTRTGWTVGAGIEYAFTRNWSGKLEYDFMDFGTRRTGTFLCEGECDDFFNFDLRQRVNMVKAGLNYRFDWGKGKAPVVARY